MSEEVPGPVHGRCAFAWCSTAHGATAHPDDEAHRSVGAGFLARVRRPGSAERGDETDVEVGLLRRLADDDTWLVIETGEGAGVALSLEGARELRRLLSEDAQIRAALA